MLYLCMLVRAQLNSLVCWCAGWRCGAALWVGCGKGTVCTWPRVFLHFEKFLSRGAAHHRVVPRECTICFVRYDYIPPVEPALCVLCVALKHFRITIHTSFCNFVQTHIVPCSFCSAARTKLLRSWFCFLQILFVLFFFLLYVTKCSDLWCTPSAYVEKKEPIRLVPGSFS